MFSDEDSDIFDRSDDSISDVFIPLSPIADRKTLDEFQRISQRRVHETDGTSTETTAKKPKPLEQNEVVISENLLFSDEEEQDFNDCKKLESGDKKDSIVNQISDIFDDSFPNEQKDQDSFDEPNEKSYRDSFDDTIEFNQNVDAENTIKYTVDEYEQLENDLMQIDELALQLKVAALLRKESEKYLSNTEKGLFPCKIESRYLSSGSQILLLIIKNNSTHTLKNWIITISWKKMEKNEHQIYSRSIELDKVEATEVKQFELFILTRNCTPLFLQAELHRVFEIDDTVSCFRIPLNLSLCSN